MRSLYFSLKLFNEVVLYCFPDFTSIGNILYFNQQYNEVDHKLEALPGDTLNGFYRDRKSVV